MLGPEDVIEGRPRTAALSVVITVYNDREDLVPTLEALAGQTRVAAEIVIADAGSTDGTLELIESWIARGLPIRLVMAPGANISEGRNIAIRASTYSRIACTDAGCRPYPRWVEALDDALDDAGFVAGIWEAIGETTFEQCVALALHPAPTEPVNGSSLTSSINRMFGRYYSIERATGRSMAFTKDAWEAASGFPERLYAGEDVSFSASISQHVDKAVLETDAVVAWRPHTTWWGTARTYARYARGSIRKKWDAHFLIRGATLLFAIALVVALLAATPSLEISLLLIAALVLPSIAVPLARARHSDLPWWSYGWRLPLIILMKDVANLIGAVQGVIDMLLSRAQPSPAHRPHRAPAAPDEAVPPRS